MIDFRYHLVSIVAVFLALAIGIVLGSTELRGAAFSALDRTSSALSGKLNAANSENSSLQQQVNGHKPGSYGTQQDASSDGPSPAPTPSAAGSTTTKTPSAKGKK